MSEAKNPQDTCVLITGGAGFIGSHTVVELLQNGYRAIIVDDLSNASAKVIDRIETIVGPQAAANLSFYGPTSTTARRLSASSPRMQSIA